MLQHNISYLDNSFINLLKNPFYRPFDTKQITYEVGMYNDFLQPIQFTDNYRLLVADTSN